MPTCIMIKDNLVDVVLETSRLKGLLVIIDYTKTTDKRRYTLSIHLYLTIYTMSASIE